MPVPQGIKITITNLEFHGDNPFSEAERAQLLGDIQHLPLNAAHETDSEWNGEVEEFILLALQKRGYFRSLVTTTPYLVRAETREHLYDVAVEVESGAQYRLGEIQFSGATIFSDVELREQFALQRNEIFDVTKVREGMESMTRLYDSKGFIDQVPEPDIFIDNEKRIVNILVKVVEGRQFRVRTAEIYGLDSETEQLLKSQLEPGQIFDSASFMKFFQKHTAALPTNASFEDAVEIRRDGRSASVEVIVDFRACPKT